MGRWKSIRVTLITITLIAQISVWEADVREEIVHKNRSFTFTVISRFSTEIITKQKFCSRIGAGVVRTGSERGQVITMLHTTICFQTKLTAIEHTYIKERWMKQKEKKEINIEIYLWCIYSYLTYDACAIVALNRLNKHVIDRAFITIFMFFWNFIYWKNKNQSPGSWKWKSKSKVDFVCGLSKYHCQQLSKSSYIILLFYVYC